MQYCTIGRYFQSTVNFLFDNDELHLQVTLSYLCNNIRAISLRLMDDLRHMRNFFVIQKLVSSYMNVEWKELLVICYWSGRSIIEINYIEYYCGLWVLNQEQGYLQNKHLLKTLATKICFTYFYNKTVLNYYRVCVYNVGNSGRISVE